MSLTIHNENFMAIITKVLPVLIVQMISTSTLYNYLGIQIYICIGKCFKLMIKKTKHLLKN